MRRAAEYGGPRRGGRARQFATFADYLRDYIAHAEHPARNREVLALLARVNARAGATPKARKVQSDRLEHLLATMGRGHADHLRDMLGELTGAPTPLPTRSPRAGRTTHERNLPRPSAQWPP